MGIKYRGATPSVIAIRRPQQENILRAWKHSRPADRKPVYETIAAIDVPVNEMSDFVLECYVPILVREIFFTMRDHVAWARTSRVDDLTQWPIFVPVLEQYGVEIDALGRQMMKDMNSSHDQDNFRMNLPLAYLTHFTMKVTPRSLVKLTMAMADEASRATDYVIKALFIQVYEQLIRCLQDTPYKQIALEGGYQKIDLLNRDYIVMDEPYKVTVLGGMVAVAVAAVPLALRAQLVRHRPVSIRDDLHQYLNGRGLACSIRNTVNIELAMTMEMAASMVKKRNCWISQDDLWRPIIDALNAALRTHPDAPLVLPCTGRNTCPIERDNILRDEMKDPAPACPIWMKMVGKTYPTEVRAGIAVRFADRRGQPEFWHKQIENMEGE